jgi:hypothetical protein
MYHIPYLFTNLSYRLFVGPLGAYSSNVGTMEKSKYRITCSAPDDPELSRIFEKGIQVFSQLQNSISKTLDQRYLLESVNDDHHLIATLSVFEKRVSILSTTLLKHLHRPFLLHPTITSRILQVKKVKVPTTTCWLLNLLLMRTLPLILFLTITKKGLTSWSATTPW